ncbi:hypothetical protein [Streptomyces clavifer]|uniref:hypothetical protein n=1 Tax=Streptomyces clavifer TaxID=68188 RepID=UPI003821B986
MVSLPVAGVAMVAIAMGGAISKAITSVSKTYYEGSVVQSTQINNPATSAECSPASATTSAEHRSPCLVSDTSPSGRFSAAGEVVRPRGQS